WQLTTIAMIGLAACAIIPGFAAAAESNEELLARLSRLERENAAIRKENVEIRSDNAALRRRLRAPAAAPRPASSPPSTPYVAPPGASDPLAYKAAPPILTYSWAGFYLGANLGYSVSRNRASELLLDPGGGPVSTQTFSLGPAGAVGGGQVGYNVQVSPHW